MTSVLAMIWSSYMYVILFAPHPAGLARPCFIHISRAVPAPHVKSGSPGQTSAVAYGARSVLRRTVVLTARRSIHVIHRSYDYGRISSFAAELVGLMGLFALFLVGAAISSVRPP